MFPRLFLLSTFLLIIPTVRLPLIASSASDFFIFCAVLWLVAESLLHSQDFKSAMPIHILWIPASMILASGLVSSISALSPLTSFGVVVKVWFVVSVWISMGIVMVRRGYLLPILYVLAAAGCVTAVVALIDQFTNIHLGDRISGNTLNVYSRQIGTFGHPNDQGFFTSVALPVAVGLLLREWQTRRRIRLLLLWGVACGLIAAALFISGSVAGWLSVVISLGIVSLVLFVGAKRRVQLMFVCIAVGMSLVGAGLISQTRLGTIITADLDFNLNRVSTITGPGRFALLEQALDHLNDSPIIGVGLDQSGTGDASRSDLVTSDVIHNTIISGWLNGGLFMFIGLVLVYLIATITALRAIRYGIREKDWLILCLGTAVFGYMLFDQTQPHLAQRFTWLILALLFGLGFGIQFLPVRVVAPVQPQNQSKPGQEKFYV